MLKMLKQIKYENKKENKKQIVFIPIINYRFFFGLILNWTKIAYLNSKKWNLYIIKNKEYIL